jgi:hypothetical protein
MIRACPLRCRDNDRRFSASEFPNKAGLVCEDDPLALRQGDLSGMPHGVDVVDDALQEFDRGARLTESHAVVER